MKASSAFRAFSVLSLVTGGISTATNSSSVTSNSTSALLADGNINLGAASDAYAKAKAYVATLTNAQKITIITGGSITDDNATWTALTSKNGGSGINMDFYVSGFLLPSALTMTWNRTAFQAHFKALGEEFYDAGSNLIYGPVSSPSGRVAYGGRNAEGFSPDPYLNGVALGESVTSLNSAGVIAVGRHFLFNEQETNRSTTVRYSANVDDKTTREVYLWSFADGVKAGMMGIMCAMNRVNETLACENNSLLSNLLKTSIGFPGVVVPDQGSQETSYGSANAGLDYGSSSLWTSTILEAGIANGSFTQARLDDMAVRNVIGYYFVGLDNGEQPSEMGTTEYRDVRRDHADIIRQTGAESLVLLKNNNDGGRGLPLNKPRTISLFGSHAGPAIAGPNRAFSVAGTPSDIYEGHLAYSGGSGQSSLSYLVTPFQSISARAIADRSMIWWILNNTYTATTSSTGGGGGGGGFGGGMPTMVSNTTTTDSNSTAAAGGGADSSNSVDLTNLGGGTASSPSIANYAANSAACLVFMNADSGEGADRSELQNTAQDSLVTTVAATCNNTIVVVNTVGPRLLDAWVEHENVTAVIYGGVLGQESGNAIADVLYGDVTPSGKLTYTIPKNASDYPAEFNICEEAECAYSEGVYIDYRYFDEQNITVRYPFGYGLSYTNFTYGDVTATTTNSSALSYTYATGALGLGGEEDLWYEVVNVTTTIQNTGSVVGAEVAQLYVTFPDVAAQPVRVLRGFEKTSIAVGETAQVVFTLRRRDLSYWDTTAQVWAVASGDYTLTVGSSSRDLRGTTTLTI